MQRTALTDTNRDHTPSDLDVLSGSLFADRFEPAARFFARNRATAPVVLWSPARHELGHPLHRRFAERCAELGQGGRGLTVETATAEAFADFSDWLMILEALPSGTDFRYLHYGSAITEYHGRDMTGEQTSDIAHFPNVFFIALYRAAMFRKEPVLSAHEPPPDVFVGHWRRLIVPVFGESGSVVRFVVLNFAQNDLAAGLAAMPMPVLVTDSENFIRFVNPAAKQIPALTEAARYRVTVADLLGPDVVLSAAPNDFGGAEETLHPAGTARIGAGLWPVTSAWILFAGLPYRILTLGATV